MIPIQTNGIENKIMYIKYIFEILPIIKYSINSDDSEKNNIYFKLILNPTIRTTGA